MRLPDQVSGDLHDYVDDTAGVKLVNQEEKCEELAASHGSSDPDTQDGRTLLPAEFKLHYDSASVPVVITHLADGWAALEKWSFEVAQAPQYQFDMCSS